MLSTRRQLASNIKWHRDVRYLTQQDLAERARIGTETIRRIEQNRGTTIRTLARIADALDVKPAALLRSRT